jgi:hypothetical protein
MTHDGPGGLDELEIYPNTLVVVSVYPGGPADRSGIREHDRLSLRFNGVPLEFESKRPGAPQRSEVFKDLATRAKVGDSLGFVTIENPLRTPGIIVDLLASLFAALTTLLLAFYLRWTQPQDLGASVFFVTAVLAASYSFLDGLRPLDSEVDLGYGSLAWLDIVAGILWASRLPTWFALPAAFYRFKKNRLRMQMFVLGTLLATLLVAVEFTLLKDVTSHHLLMELFSKAVYWMFLMTVGFGIMYSSPKEPTGVSSQPVAA